MFYDEESDSHPAWTSDGFDFAAVEGDAAKSEWNGPRTCNEGESSRSRLLRGVTSRGTPGDVMIDVYGVSGDLTLFIASDVVV